MDSLDTVVRPFRGLRYDIGCCRDLSALICPPYDIITEQRQTELYERHPHNFVRVELPREEGPEGRYASAAATLAKWRAQGVIVQEARPAIYLLEQEFSLEGERRRRRGVLCLVRLPEDREKGHVLSHEGTLAAARADRLELMRACGAMTSPVMVIHEDRREHLLEWLERPRGPAHATADEDGITNRLWLVDDESEVEALCRAVGPGPLAIADGHHRFETAMTYREEMRRRYPEAPAAAAFNYALTLVTSARDPGLVILPTHRVVSGAGEAGRAALREAMRSAFLVSTTPLRAGGPGSRGWVAQLPDRAACAVYLGGDQYYVLTPRPGLLRAVASAAEGTWVSLVHRHLLDPALRAVGGSGWQISYVTDEREAVGAVQAGVADAAVLMPPTRVEEVLAVAKAGQRMPGKSTYFYPKVPAGLVLAEATADPVE